jgi:hypothetical protein
MLTEAAAAGFYESKDFPGRYPRLQILTIAELLAGKKLEYPAHRDETFAKAEQKTKSQQEGLFQPRRHAVALNRFRRYNPARPSRLESPCLKNYQQS